MDDEPPIETLLEPGVPSERAYIELLHSPSYRKMESFSDDFLEKNRHSFTHFGKKWRYDSLHRWNRQWEYPYSWECVRRGMATIDRRPVNILDAGSGATFFPFFLVDQFPDCSIVCCDNSPHIDRFYSEINHDPNIPIHFHRADLRRLPFQADQFDILYCISVLEHIKERATILQEFRRVLVPNGLLIVTFDISLGRKGDLTLRESEDLLWTLTEMFEPEEGVEIEPIPTIPMPEEIITRHRIIRKGLAFEPRRQKLYDALREAQKGRNPFPLSRDQTLYCGSFRSTKV